MELVKSPNCTSKNDMAISYSLYNNAKDRTPPSNLIMDEWLEEAVSLTATFLTVSYGRTIIMVMANVNQKSWFFFSFETRKSVL